MEYINVLGLKKEDAEAINKCLAGDSEYRDYDVTYDIELENNARLLLHLWGADKEDMDNKNISPGVVASFMTPGIEWFDSDEEETFFGLWTFYDEEEGDEYSIFVYCEDPSVKVVSNFVSYA